MSLTSTTIDVNGRSTEVLSAGEGEPVVILHGGGIIEGFDCFEPLAAHVRLLAPLRPGYGATESDPVLGGRQATVEHVREVFDSLGIEQAVLVGHSLGGWLAAAFAAQFPERLSGLVLGAPWGSVVPEHRGADMRTMSPPEIVATLTNDPSIFDGRFPSGPDPAFEAARAREGQALQSLLPGPGDPELATLLPQIRAATLLLWGEDDKVNPASQASEWVQAIPHGTIKTFDATGHLLFHERPDTVEAISQFAVASRSPT